MSDQPESFAFAKEQSGHHFDEESPFAPEPMFATLLRRAVQKIWQNDPVMTDFVNHIAQPLSDLLGHKAAKGGKFAADMKAMGKDTARYDYDQSMRGHLINGLFPALHIAKTLKAWNAPQFRHYDEGVVRLFIAGFVLHDWLKFPEMEDKLKAAGFSHDDSIGPEQMPHVEALFIKWCDKLGITPFLKTLGGPSEVLHDLIYITCNTQIRWGTLRNLSVLPRLNPDYRHRRTLAMQLSRLADYLTYIARNPRDVAANSSIRTVISQLSNRTAYFTYHHLADNRGILTNIIHQSSLEAMQDDARAPILYAPSGVVYLTKKDAPAPPAISVITDSIVTNIKVRIRRRLLLSLTGFKRDGKGLKFADYYWSFFDLSTLINLGIKATFNVIHEGKKPSAGKRFEKMKNWLTIGSDLKDDLRVDQLAEWSYFAEKLVATEYKNFDTAGLLLKEMGLEHLRANFDAIPRDNRAGGVGYHWYFAAGHYLNDFGGGLDPEKWRQKVETLAKKLVAALPNDESAQNGADQEDNWQDLRAYIGQVLTIGGQTVRAETFEVSRDNFATELHRYRNAKRKGRGTTHVCSLCSSPFEINKQKEAAVLFAPQVYSNRLPLHSTNALRDICSVCSLEMMLRQLLMNPGKASGKNFEGQKMRYLYFYPTYFFTPETLQIIREVYAVLNKPSFTELKKHLITGQGLETTVNLDPVTLQRLEPFLLNLDPEKNRDMRFSTNEPATFYFLGINPPGRDAKDAEAWVHPAFFALLLPLCLDVKVIASESPLPLMVEADEMSETVFLDGAHAFVGHLTQKERLNIDEVLPTLQRLMTAYLIQVDGNSGMGRSGFDYRWQDIPALARNLAASPLYAFYYLKKWQRKEKLDNLPVGKAHLYLNYVKFLDERSQSMSHAQELTTLYRQFYKAKGFATNSILRPLDIGTKTILAADPRMFDTQEAMREVVFGEIQRRINKLQQDGLAFFPKGSVRESREEAMRKFSNYLVDEVYYGAFRGDASALQGKQLNLLGSACEAIYRTEDAKDRAEAAEDKTLTNN